MQVACLTPGRVDGTHEDFLDAANINRPELQMTGRPKNYRAMLLAVQHAEHPDLDGTDSALLMCIAINAHGTNGAGSRPGNACFASASKLGERGVKKRLQKIIGLGLTERTEVGDGRGKASTYRLCLENSAYPDVTPTGELLIAETGNYSVPASHSQTGNSDVPGFDETDAKAGTPADPVSDGKAGTPAFPDSPKPGTAEAKAGTLAFHTSQDHLSIKERERSPFELFWEEYPRKVAKQEAMKAWKKIQGDTCCEQICSALRQWKKSKQWQDPDYVPYPSSFLNKRRWEGELPAAAPNGNSNGHPEARVGIGPEANGGVNPAYLEFKRLYEQGSIPKTTSWAQWKPLSQEDRQQLVSNGGQHDA